PLAYKSAREHWYADEFVLQDLPMGEYAIEANCSREDHLNGTGRIGLNITRVELPDLVTSELSLVSVVDTKVTARVRIKNTGSIPLIANDTSPVVTCLWDGYGRNLFSHVLNDAELQPGGSFEFIQHFFYSKIEKNNTLVARVDCNNNFPEEKEDNNEKSINFGRYG
ncbi:MAG: CARDB domain-containing protein, partial [Candidatus Micrarchaeota archaeon]